MMPSSSDIGPLSIPAQVEMGRELARKLMADSSNRYERIVETERYLNQGTNWTVFGFNREMRRCKFQIKAIYDDHNVVYLAGPYLSRLH
jgi:hypothetical protein